MFKKLLLWLSYVPLFYVLMLFAELSFAPWDSAVFNIPEIGTWQRTLNDFFDLGMGSYLAALLPITISLLQIYRSRRAFSHWRMIFSNLLLPPLIFASANVIFTIHNAIFVAGERSYWRSILPLLLYLGLLGLWLQFQKHVLAQGEKSKNQEKAKNDFKRLEDALEDVNVTDYEVEKRLSNSQI